MAIDDFLKAVDASPKVSAVIFTGKDVLGFSHNRYNPYLSEELNKRHIPVVLIEAQNQLGFEPQQGILDKMCIRDSLYIVASLSCYVSDTYSNLTIFMVLNNFHFS